jgi:hypothetical protein|nr:MAG TPA: hypothetical protein [Caudoviricetes sp.]
MLLLTQDGEIINLDRMAIIDTASLNVYARQGMGERGIILGSYDDEGRCYDIISEIYEEYSKGMPTYTMPRDGE